MDVNPRCYCNAIDMLYFYRPLLDYISRRKRLSTTFTSLYIQRLIGYLILVDFSVTKYSVVINESHLTKSSKPLKTVLNNTLLTFKLYFKLPNTLIRKPNLHRKLAGVQCERIGCAKLWGQHARPTTPRPKQPSAQQATVRFVASSVVSPETAALSGFVYGCQTRTLFFTNLM